MVCNRDDDGMISKKSRNQLAANMTAQGVTKF